MVQYQPKEETEMGAPLDIAHANAPDVVGGEAVTIGLESEVAGAPRDIEHAQNAELDVASGINDDAESAVVHEMPRAGLRPNKIRVGGRLRSNENGLGGRLRPIGSETDGTLNAAESDVGGRTSCSPLLGLRQTAARR